MKFRNYLESITGIEIYPLISLIIFVAFFIILLYYVFKADRSYIKHLEELPFDKEQKSNIYE
ncbi:MAG: CcoQ/FixQ family Cbb3-type cytochrome c oxidase assembly chaperone [Bacteroidia bacterium]|nr:CcoQ/FixQ family Cbb3-type cytochrome c oxidase assembly chaperone [Bacteroidia bacterium]